MPGKMARSGPRLSVRVTRGAGGGHTSRLSCKRAGKENANIDAGLGFIWRISAKILVAATSDRLGSTLALARWVSNIRF